MPPQRAPVASLYRREEVIGRGTFGVVYKGINVETKQVVAIKVLNLDIVDEEVKDVQQEITLLSSLAKSEVQNIITYYGSFLSGTRLWIIMDYCSGGSISALLKAGRIEERYSAVIMREMLIALQFIHNQGIIHRDIKGENVLISRDGHVYLCDFGVAAQLTAAQFKRTSMIGTPYWMAPEVINSTGYNQKADIWSLGITLYEITTGRPPFADQEIKRAVKLIPASKPTRLEGSQYSAPLKEFVALCLDEQPDSRPSAEELLKGRFIKATKSVPYVILKDLVTRYQQWKERNNNPRDNFLNPNAPGASLSDEEEDDAYSFDWDFSSSEQDKETGAKIQQNTLSTNQNFNTQTNNADSNFPTSNANGQTFSQAATFKGEDGYFSSHINSAMGTAIATPMGQMASPNGRIDKHPLLEMFEEQPGEFNYSNSATVPRLEDGMNINIDSDSKANIDPYIDTRPTDANWGGIETQYNTRNAAAMGTERGPANISMPPTVNGNFASLTNQIEIPSIDDLSSSSSMFPQTPLFLNTPSSSASTPNLPTHFKTGGVSQHPPAMGSNVDHAGSANMVYINPNSAANSASGVNLSNWGNMAAYNTSQAPHRPSISSASTNGPRINQPTLPVKGAIEQSHTISPGPPLTTSASEINLNSAYTHQAPPPITDIAGISRRTPSPKRAVRQASIKSSNSPLTMSSTPITSSSNRIPSQSSQISGMASKLSTEYMTEETAIEKSAVKGHAKPYIQSGPNTPHYIIPLATSFSTTSLPTMASASAAPYQSASGASTPSNYDGVSLREATLSSAHLKHITQRKLSSSSASVPKPTPAAYKIAQLRGTPAGSSTSHSDKNEAHDDKAKSQSKGSEPVEHLHKIQEYQQQQYNQRLQHLQQQQLKESLSASSVMVPASVPIPQEMFSTVSKHDDLKEGKLNRANIYNSDTTKDEQVSAGHATVRYKNMDSEKESRIKVSKEHTKPEIAIAVPSRLRNPSFANFEEAGSQKQSGIRSELEQHKRLQFPTLRPLNCNILLDSASKEMVVAEFSHQLDSFINALDAIEQKLSTFAV